MQTAGYSERFGARVVALVIGALAAALVVVGAAGCKRKTPRPGAAPAGQVGQGPATQAEVPPAGQRKGGEGLAAHDRSDNKSIQLGKYLGPQRDAWQTPKKVVAALPIQPGWTVADIGTASGYFAYHLSAPVGRSGKVYAVDVDLPAIEYLRRRIEKTPPPFANIEPVHSDFFDVMLPAESLDLAFMADAHFFLDPGERNRRCVASVFAAVKPGGRLAVIEHKQTGERGTVSLERLSTPWVKAGFVMERTLDLLSKPSEASPKGQWFVLFRRPAT